MKIVSGTFTGTAATFAITGVGFNPDVIIVKSRDTVDNAWFRTSNMPANTSYPIRNDQSSQTSAIISNDTDGFTVSTEPQVNTAASVYFYTCLKIDSQADLAVFSYTGNGADGLAITGLGFQPGYVLTKSNAAVTGASRFASSTDTSMHFGGAERGDSIVTLDTDGFTVNNGDISGGNIVNVNATVHYGFAIKEVAGYSKVITFNGTGTTNAITGVGFQSNLIIGKSNDGNSPVYLSDAMNYSSAWHTSSWCDGVLSTTGITVVGTDGFTANSDGRINGAVGVAYRVLCVKNYVPTSVPSYSSVLMMGI